MSSAAAAAAAEVAENSGGDALVLTEELLPEELVCELCLGLLSEPKRLSCSHSFCLVCLQRQLKKRSLSRAQSEGSIALGSSPPPVTTNGANATPLHFESPERSTAAAGGGARSEVKYPCPTCGKITAIPGGDAERLGTSTALCRLLEATCSGWTDADREEARQLIRRRRSSTVTLTASETKPLSSSREMSVCAEHSSVLEFYCVECKMLVCGHCMLSQHRSHIDQVKSAQEAEDRMAAVLRSLMQPSCEAVHTASEVTTRIGELKKVVVDESTVATNHIKQFFQQARELLEEREAELAGRVEAESLRAIADLTRKEEVIRRNVGLLSRYVEQVRATLQQPGDMAAVTSTHGLIPTLEFIHKQIHDVSLQLTQGEKLLNLTFEGAPTDFSELGSLSTESDTGEGGYVMIKGGTPLSPTETSPTRSLETISECTQSVSHGDGPIYEEPFATASYSRRGPNVPPTVSLTRRSAGSTRNKVRVRLKQIISCDEQTSNMKPCGIAVGETDAVIVSDIHSHCVKVIARSGKVMDTITGPQSPEQIYGPVCLTTDSENQLYILDKEGKKAIYRFKNGKFDNAFTNKVHKSGKLNQPWGMAVSGDQIYVTDWQKSCIHIIQTNGKYKDVLNCGQQSQAVLKHPVGIATTPDGGLVVADHQSHCVWRVAHTKEVVEFQQIGSDNILESPYGVAVTREGHIVVTDTGKSHVCLFSSSGMFLAHLGKKGNGEGEFLIPRHVCVTRTGEILVADEGNQRIQIFEVSGLN